MTWEAGNEMEFLAIRPGTTGESPGDYDTGRYNVVRSAISGMIDGINSADPNAQVAVGIAGIHFGFLERLAADGVRWDITSEHYFAYPGATDTAMGADQLFARLADFGRPIVMTEFNQQQGSYWVPSEQTATLLTMMDAIEALAPKYNIIGAYVYELLDQTQLTGEQAHYGLANGDGALTAGGRAVQNHLAQIDVPPSATLLTGRSAIDTGSSATDNVTSSVSFSGTAPPDTVLQFTVGGVVVAAVAADASGSWSWVPTGLPDGFHVVAAISSAGSGSLGITLDTKAPIPVISNGALTNGVSSLTGITGGAGDTVALYNDNTLVGTTTSATNGSWSWSSASPIPGDVVLNFRAEGVDLAGNVGRSSDIVVLGTGSADTLAGGSGNDRLYGAGGHDILWGAGGADQLSGGAGSDTFTYSAISDSTSSAPDIIIDFQHGSDTIDFRNIAGLAATNGIARIQGELSATGNQTLNAYSVAYMEVGGNTHLLVNTSSSADIVSGTDTRAAEMVIVLTGSDLGLTTIDLLYT